MLLTIDQFVNPALADIAIVIQIEDQVRIECIEIVDEATGEQRRGWLLVRTSGPSVSSQASERAVRIAERTYRRKILRSLSDSSNDSHALGWSDGANQ